MLNFFPNFKSYGSDLHLILLDDHSNIFCRKLIEYSRILDRYPKPDRIKFGFELSWIINLGSSSGLDMDIKKTRLMISIVIPIPNSISPCFRFLPCLMSHFHVQLLQNKSQRPAQRLTFMGLVHLDEQPLVQFRLAR